MSGICRGMRSIIGNKRPGMRSVVSLLRMEDQESGEHSAIEKGPGRSSPALA
jgi:hypothetical protein